MTDLRRRMVRDMTVRGFSPRTLTSYVAAVRRLAKYYRRSPDTLSVEEVQNYLARMIAVEHLSWSTCAVASNAFRFLYHVTLGRSTMEFEVPQPRQPQRLPEILSIEEVARLLEAAARPHHRLLLMTTYACGLRVSEALHLRFSDIDGDRMTVRIDQGKGKKDRYVPLPQRLRSELDRHRAQQRPSPWVFPGSRSNRPLHVTAAQKAYGLAKQRAGITKHGGIHALRHAFATHLIESGTDILTVQRLLGHRHVTTTMRYFHLSQGRLTVARSPLDLLDLPRA